MSVAEMIQELPKLTHHERRELCQKILELEANQDDIEFAMVAARSGFSMLDQMEAEDEANDKRH